MPRSSTVPVERICRLMRRMEGHEEVVGFEGEPMWESFRDDALEILGERHEGAMLPNGLFGVKLDS